MAGKIKKIKSIIELGIFRDFVAAADLPDFKGHNLIYGFNGSGKTTLSRIFSSLATGVYHPGLPKEGRFEIELSDGSTIKSSADIAALTGSILIFNVDFIEENLQWKSGIANPVFYIGKEQADLGARLNEVEGEIARIQSEKQKADATYRVIQKTFVDFKRDVAKSVDLVGLGYRYQAPQLEEDYVKKVYDTSKLLTEEKLASLQDFILEKEAHPRLQVSGINFGNLFDLLEVARKLTSVSLGTLALEELRLHSTMLPWVKTGLEYHDSHELEDCLFCGGQITADRRSKLGKVIDEKFDNLMRDLKVSQNEVRAFAKELERSELSLPSDFDVSPDVRPYYAVAREVLRRHLSAGVSCSERIAVALGDKMQSPNKIEFLDLEKLLTELTDFVSQAASGVSNFNNIIAAHNSVSDSFLNRKAEAKDHLKSHFLATNQVRYSELLDAVVSENERVDELGGTLEKLKAQAEGLRTSMRQHGPAADRINQLIHSYLGRDELQIGVQGEGFEIHRNGKLLSGYLSEGEKTALALCYFLSTLEAENRNAKDLIVVIDDPISSLDTKALFHAFSLIKGLLNEAGQLIVLTHNLSFMLEIKKWLKRRYDKGEASFYFLDARQIPGENRRQSNIVPLHKLIREYESEYQYLFFLVYSFNLSADFQSRYLYLMPNALRKVLELFLAFKMPNSSGLANKIEAIAKGGFDLDAAKIVALDRLIQSESHADSLDDFISLSAITLEQTQEAASALLTVIQVMDGAHYDQMIRLVS